MWVGCCSYNGLSGKGGDGPQSRGCHHTQASEKVPQLPASSLCSALAVGFRSPPALVLVTGPVVGRAHPQGLLVEPESQGEAWRLTEGSRW